MSSSTVFRLVIQARTKSKSNLSSCQRDAEPKDSSLGGLFELFDLLRQGFLGTLKTSAAIRVMRSAKPLRFGSACSRGSARLAEEV